MTDASAPSKEQTLHCIGYSPTLSGFGIREEGPDGELIATFRRESDAQAYMQLRADLRVMTADRDGFADIAERRYNEREQLRADIQELTCGDPRRACPNCRGQFASETGVNADGK